MNKVIMMGRLTRDPELRNTTSGIEVANFSIAIDRYAKKGEEKKTDFFDCIAWRGTGVFVEKYFRKGDGILFEGTPTTEEWTDKEGNKRRAVKFVVDNVYFPIPKKSENSIPSYSAPESISGNVLPEDTGDLPF